MAWAIALLCFEARCEDASRGWATADARAEWVDLPTLVADLPVLGVDLSALCVDFSGLRTGFAGSAWKAKAKALPNSRTPRARTMGVVRRMRGVRRIQSIFSVRRVRREFECLQRCAKV